MNKIDLKLSTLKIKPHNHELFLRAFTHATFANENSKVKSYERLEFLGDAILNKCSADYIYQNYLADEGKMSLLKIEAVKGSSLTDFSIQEGFDRLIRFGNTKEKINLNKKVLEDVFEAFLGALYLDQGEAAVKKFLVRNVFAYIDQIYNQELKNPKTILQEFLQGKSRQIILYQTVKKGNYFEAKVSWDNQLLGIGQGASKKKAEIAAAKIALEKVGQKDETN